VCGCESAARLVECSGRKAFLWQADGPPYKGIIDCDSARERFHNINHICPECRYHSNYLARAGHKLSKRLRKWSEILIYACNRETTHPVDTRSSVGYHQTPVRLPEREIQPRAPRATTGFGDGRDITSNALLSTDVNEQDIDGRFSNPRPAPIPIPVSSSSTGQPMVSREEQAKNASTVRDIQMHYQYPSSCGAKREVVGLDTWKTFYPPMGTPGLAW